MGDDLKYNPTIHHRRSIRLKGYDYSQAGLYYITICTQNQLCLFGDIQNQEMILNDAGKVINQWWNEMKCKYKNIELHEHIIMPNHFHGIIQIANTPVGADLCVCPDIENKENNVGDLGKGEHIGSPLHEMVQWFKTMTTNEYIRGVKQKNWKRFDKKLW